MKRNYICPEITVKTFSDSIHTTEAVPTPAPPTSAVVMAEQYFKLDFDREKVREVLIMKK